MALGVGIVVLERRQVRYTPILIDLRQGDLERSLFSSEIRRLAKLRWYSSVLTRKGTYLNTSISTDGFMQPSSMQVGACGTSNGSMKTRFGVAISYLA